MANGDQKILFIGKTTLGAVHDYKMLKEEFPPCQPWFKHKCVYVDLGYIGFKKDYQVGSLKIPYKKPYKTKNRPKPKLTPQQKDYNKAISSVRVKVENAIGGIKRYNILVQRFRNKSVKLRDDAIFLAAGIWNWTKVIKFS